MLLACQDATNKTIVNDEMLFLMEQIAGTNRTVDGFYDTTTHDGIGDVGGSQTRQYDSTWLYFLGLHRKHTSFTLPHLQVNIFKNKYFYTTTSQNTNTIK
jgi:hypothetical protein